MGVSGTTREVWLWPYSLALQEAVKQQLGITPHNRGYGTYLQVWIFPDRLEALRAVASQHGATLEDANGDPL